MLLEILKRAVNVLKTLRGNAGKVHPQPTEDVRLVVGDIEQGRIYQAVPNVIN